MTTVAVTIITKNEVNFIRTCLDSVRWADEIIIVDSGSTDGTVEICREYTDQIMLADWPGFGPQKNRALARATSEWVLSLDADEHVSPQLKQEILSAISAPEAYAAFDLPRRSSYCGRRIRHSGWWPDYVTRLFRRGSARFSDDLVHEHLIVDGRIGRLREPLSHVAFENLENVLETMNHYSTLGARMMHNREKKGTMATAVLHGFWSFFNTYVVRAGFLDGREGFMLAVSNAEGTYYKYLKLLLLTERK
ncbi:MAG: glycosyltransferase family 2 protein [Deltaproteobacteria bacterium]|nr:glycosyltransferase family 2 protein [Deltaproteobacteria bacterium]